MTTSIFSKGLFAGLAAVAISGAALAQSTPPNPAAKDPAVGAGQQSTQSTPMGTTGTPSNSGSATGSSSTMGASGSTSSSTSATTDSSMSSGSTAANTTTRATKADRN
jgi:hypothetical protein